MERHITIDIRVSNNAANAAAPKLGNQLTIVDDLNSMSSAKVVPGMNAFSLPRRGSFGLNQAGPRIAFADIMTGSS